MRNGPEPLWDDDRLGEDHRDGWYGLTPERGSYFISRSLFEIQPDVLPKNRVAITEYMRAAGKGTVELLTTTIDAICAYRTPRTAERLDRLMLYIARRSNYQIKWIRLFENEEVQLLPVAREIGVPTTDDVLAHLDHLEKQGLINTNIISSAYDASPTIDGLIYLDERENDRANSKTCFVAMWFGEEMSESYVNGIAPAVQQNGYNPVRIDAKEHNNKIDDEIIKEIRRSKFVIADFSCGPDGARGGVYFEAGFAMALGIPVIFCVRAGDLDRVHFDTRQFSHIVWENCDDLRSKLVNRIAATIM